MASNSSHLYAELPRLRIYMIISTCTEDLLKLMAQKTDWLPVQFEENQTSISVSNCQLNHRYSASSSSSNDLATISKKHEHLQAMAPCFLTSKP
jgi:hypothetical protein